MQLRLKQVDYTLKYKCLPKEFDGFTIALISDLHDQEFPFRYNEMITKMIEENIPDVIMLGGDMHHVKINNDRYIGFLEKLTEIAPVFFAEGNHDCESENSKYPGYKEYKNAMKDLGVLNLRGDGARLFAKNSENYINISGASWDDKGEVEPNYEDGAFNIFLMHDPNSFDTVEKRPELMLSGHIHGGMVRLPNGQGIFAPGCGAKLRNRFSPEYFLPKYTYGVYGKNKKLIVTSGLGNSVVPFRFISPEVVIITLKHAD